MRRESLSRRSILPSLGPVMATLALLAVTSGGESPRPSRYTLLRREPLPIRRDVQCWTALRQQNVVIQTRDYSCGAAALATVLQNYFEDPVTEDDVLNQALKELDESELADRQENGLSLDDLFAAAQGLGYQAAVVDLPAEKIPDLPAPVVIRLTREDFRHFVVLRGSIGDRIYLADPLRGQVRLSAERFMEQWSGEALLLGKADFGLPERHGLSLPADGPGRIELVPVRRWLPRNATSTGTR